MRRTLPLTVLAFALAAVTGGVPATLARFTDDGNAAGAIGADTLTPPSGLTASGGTSTVTLAWTPTTDSWATGYDVLRSATSGSGHTVVASVTPGSATTTVNSPGAGTWFYVLQSVFQSWRSVSSNEASATVTQPSTTTPWRDCTSNAPDTSGAGDNNGYQSNPARACADDGLVATDSNSGSNSGSNTDSCGTGATPASTEDRHRFWGYPMGLPGSVTSIDGIEVRLDAGLNNNGGDSNICVQLSWNGGSTWTTIQSQAMNSTGLTTYVFGGASDTWGRTWTVANFSTANFRIRVIDASDRTNKQFRLDYAAVRVTYTP